MRRLRMGGGRYRLRNVLINLFGTSHVIVWGQEVTWGA
jgi:hypothetical protein